MMQPYIQWDLPEEGLVLYDVKKKAAINFENEIQIEIDGFGCKVFQMSPVTKGWALIGRTDKYLPASAVKMLVVSEKILKFTIEEPGVIGIYCKNGDPQAKGFKTIKISENYYELTPVSGAKIMDRVTVSWQ